MIKFVRSNSPKKWIFKGYKMPNISSAKKWFLKNRFSILASSLAFILSTAVNQGIDWYKDNQDQDATKTGIINETTKNMDALIRFNKKNPTFDNNCNHTVINQITTKNLVYLPMMFSSEYYLSNSQKNHGSRPGFAS